MKAKLLDIIDFEKVDILLEGFNKSTGFVTAILDLEGNVLSKSGWRQICTEFHRIHPETSKKCTISDTVLAGKLADGEKYHFYQCLNGLIDVAVPIVIKNEHIANLFSGQFFFEDPDNSFFKKQAEKYGFNEKIYLKALGKVPVVSKEKVLEVMDFLLNMTQLISDMTFQKLEQMEDKEALKESEKYNRMLFEQSAIGLLLTSLDGKLIDINKACANIIGRTIEEAKTLTYWDITPEKYQNQEQQQLESLSKTGRYGPYEKEYIHKDGHLVPVRLQGLIIDRNKEKYIWSSVEDITESKQAEENLRESEYRFRKLYEDGAIGMVMVGKDFKFITANRSFCQMVGYQEKELQQLTFLDITHPDDMDKDIPQVKKMIAGEIDIYKTEKRYLNKSGQTIWTQLTLSTFYDSNGQFLYNLAIIINITDRKNAEEILKESYALIKIAGEIAKLGGWIVNLDENRCYWSDEVAAIHEMPIGYSPLVEEGIGFYAPEWRDKITEVFTNCAQNGVPYDEEMQIITSKGKSVWVRAIGEAVRDENGKIVKVQGAFQDISERKISEKALLAKMDELERFQKLTVGREITMIALKKEVNNLLNKLGQDNKYNIIE
ncbi:MAG TPA: PAS domain S-box protein [Flavobacteriaceae bacterium]|jgi:PAS domain S-box-containing protein|nr:PAS domain S-box protein [Flavobacteriaceae bacterium]